MGVTNPVGSRAFNDKREATVAGGVSVGYNFKERYNTPLRLEVNYTARSDANNNPKSAMMPGSGNYIEHTQKISLNTLTFNIWADIPTNSAFTPYVGGGLGAAFIDYQAKNTEHFSNGITADVFSASQKKTNFAWNIGGEVAYDVNAQFTVDLGYRYLDAGKISINKNVPTFNSGGTTPVNQLKIETRINSNELFLEGRYKF